MFHNSICKLVTKTKNDAEGLAFELNYYIQLNENELVKLKELREKYANTSSIHYNFNDSSFWFSQKKYFKKAQFINEPPKLDVIESSFLDDIKTTLNQYKNFLHFDKLENLEKSKEINLNEVLKRI